MGLFFWSALAPASAGVLEIAPGGDWCGAVNAALPGDEVRLAANLLLPTDSRPPPGT